MMNFISAAAARAVMTALIVKSTRRWLIALIKHHSAIKKAKASKTPPIL
jgi:hypothetical protein